MVRGIANNETFASKTECFLNSPSRGVLKVLQIEFAIQQSIRIAAMCTQVLLEHLRRSVVISSENERLNRGEVSHLEDQHHAASPSIASAES